MNVKIVLVTLFSFLLSILYVFGQFDESDVSIATVDSVNESFVEDNLTISEILESASFTDLSYSKGFSEEPDLTSRGRLPRDLLPYHYNLTLKPIINGEPPFRFWGRVHIHFECVQNTSFFIINDYPAVSSVNISLDQSNEKPLPVPVLGSFVRHKTRGMLVFRMRNGFVEGGKYIFKADFSRKMSYNAKGLYWADYTSKHNVTKYMASTHFQPVGAHKVFPCFDEIDMKSTFNISVVRQANHISLSNAPLIRTIHLSDGWFEDYFDTTPRMSTYLVCIVVGEFEKIMVTSHSETNISVSLYAVDSQINYLGYAAKHAKTLLKWFYENVFHPFRELKIDHVAIPFRSAAMENWGLITYSEDILCISNKTSSLSSKVRMLAIVSHEIAHMRFGNLVTCKWWTDLWIQEGVATYFNFLPTEALGMEASQLQQARFVDGLHRIMTMDQKNNSRQVMKFASNPSDSFSPVVYYKTAALLRHVQGIVSRPVLFRIFERFLEKYAFENVDTRNFVDVLNEQVKNEGIRYPNGEAMDFEVILIPWFTQIGLPLITTTKVNDSFVRASQSRYFNPRNESSNSTNNHLWEIPMTLIGNESNYGQFKGRPTHWIRINETSALINISETTGGNDWYILNPDQDFYYRVLYDEENRKNLARQLCSNHSVISIETRAQLIDDTFDLARNAYLSLPDALEFTKYLVNEEEHNPWEATLHHVNTVATFFEDEPYFNELRIYMRNLLDSLLDKLGYEFPENESTSKSLLRALAIPAACSFGSGGCLSHVRSLYENYIAEPDVDSVDPNVLPAVLCWGVFEGTTDDWQAIYDQYQARKKSPIKNERMAYLQALVCSTNTTLLDRIYEDILKGNIRRYALFASSRYLSDKFWDLIRKSGAPNPRKLKPFENVIEKFYSEEQLRQLKELETNESDVEQLLMQSILQVESNIKFREENREPLGRWLRNNVDASGRTSDEMSPEVAVDSTTSRDDRARVRREVVFRPPRWTAWSPTEMDLF